MTMTADLSTFRLDGKSVTEKGIKNNRNSWIDLTVVPNTNGQMLLMTFSHSYNGSSFFTNAVVQLMDLLSAIHEETTSNQQRKVFTYLKMEDYLTLDPNSEISFYWNKGHVSLICNLNALVNHSATVTVSIKDLVQALVGFVELEAKKSATK